LFLFLIFKGIQYLTFVALGLVECLFFVLRRRNSAAILLFRGFAETVVFVSGRGLGCCLVEVTVQPA
jgi:hypothetical protein